MSRKVESENRRMSQAIHGAINFRELESLGLSHKEVRDFSSTVNPFGLAPSVEKAIQDTTWNAYPDRECLKLKDAIARRHSCRRENILVGNGLSEILHLISCTYLSHNDQSFILGPTYSEYQRVSVLAGAQVLTLTTTPDSNFQIPLKDIETALSTEQPRVAFFCRPNNPTGELIPSEAISRWTKLFPETLFVVDEAYLEFCPDEKSCFQIPSENLIVLRSFTKAYGLAGLRVGYALGASRVIEELQHRQIPWSVNAAAQNAALATLNSPGNFEHTLKLWKKSQETLIGKLKPFGVPIHAPLTGFLLWKIGNARDVREQLLKFGIIVRDCRSFGLPEYLRISPRVPEENQILVDLLHQVLS